MSGEVAWSAFHNPVLCIGAIAIFSYVATLPRLLWIPSLLALFFLWLFLYSFEYNWRKRRFEGFRY